MKLSTLFAYATVAIAGTEAWSFTVWTEKDQKGKQRHYHSSLGDNDCYNFDDSITSKGVGSFEFCSFVWTRCSVSIHSDIGCRGKKLGSATAADKGFLWPTKWAKNSSKAGQKMKSFRIQGCKHIPVTGGSLDIASLMVPGNGTNWPLSMDVRAPRLHCPQRSSSIGCNGEPAVGHLTSWFQVTRHGYTRVATTALASSETFFATVAQNASPKGSGTRRLSKLRAERREVRKPRVQRLDSCAAGLVAYCSSSARGPASAAAQPKGTALEMRDGYLIRPCRQRLPFPTGRRHRTQATYKSVSDCVALLVRLGGSTSPNAVLWRPPPLMVLGSPVGAGCHYEGVLRLRPLWKQGMRMARRWRLCKLAVLLVKGMLGSPCYSWLRSELAAALTFRARCSQPRASRAAEDAAESPVLAGSSTCGPLATSVYATDDPTALNAASIASGV
ncbi:hypothetical protein Purlil1_10701 [Purpureocillium lilacinum]|uniref:Uncharacterized protein n=1 Tax=Purpureocillium lilacinum TaxID=33203 RepID=A0ABR0BM21_PURLI|nr:hypothetical protein Purlil1_10701 [Purpureocillium lilacinum]